MSHFLSMVFQEFTNFDDVDTTYFDVNNIPFNLNTNNITLQIPCMDFCDSQVVISFKYLGTHKNTIYYIGKQSKKVKECKYFHTFLLLIYDTVNEQGIIINTPFTKSISWFAHKMYHNLKLSVCYDIFRFYFMHDINFSHW